MATRRAAQHHPASTICYDRPRLAGKPLQVARCAAARKLLHLAWALGTKQQHCDPTKHHHHPAPADPPATPEAA